MDGLRSDQLTAVLNGGIRKVVISMTGPSATGVEEEAYMLIYEYGWADTTWRNRIIQVRKWLNFC